LKTNWKKLVSAVHEESTPTIAQSSGQSSKVQLVKTVQQVKIKSEKPINAIKHTGFINSDEEAQKATLSKRVVLIDMTTESEDDAAKVSGQFLQVSF